MCTASDILHLEYHEYDYNDPKEVVASRWLVIPPSLTDHLIAFACWRNGDGSNVAWGFPAGTTFLRSVQAEASHGKPGVRSFHHQHLNNSSLLALWLRARYRVSLVSDRKSNALSAARLKPDRMDFVDPSVFNRYALKPMNNLNRGF